LPAPAPQRVTSAAIVKFRAFEEENGTLVPLTALKEIPFPIGRIFYVYGVAAGDIRGEHAHRECHQMLVCLRGICEITVDDGTETRSFALDSPKQGLHVPPTLWATQRYGSRDTVLLVVTDQPYNEADYLRDYDAFLAFRGVARRRAANG